MNNISKFEQQHKDLDTLKAMAAVAVKSGKYNASDYNEATVLNIFMTARAIGVDPMLALNGGFNIIKGKISMGAHFMSALARRAGHSIKIVEMTSEKCTIIGKRKDNEDSLKYEMTWEEAKSAKLTSKATWQDNPKQMLYCACIRNVFRILFSDIAIPYDADEMNVEDSVHQSEDVGLMESMPSLSIPCEVKQIDSRAKEPELQTYSDEDLMEILKGRLEEDGIPSERLGIWIGLRSAMKNQTAISVVKACLEKDVLPKFKKSFADWLMKDSPVEAAV